MFIKTQHTFRQTIKFSNVFNKFKKKFWENDRQSACSDSTIQFFAQKWSILLGNRLKILFVFNNLIFFIYLKFKYHFYGKLLQFSVHIFSRYHTFRKMEYIFRHIIETPYCFQ